eukprot:749553-Hanusia_phi.AAC.1
MLQRALTEAPVLTHFQTGHRCTIMYKDASDIALIGAALHQLDSDGSERPGKKLTSAERNYSTYSVSPWQTSTHSHRPSQPGASQYTDRASTKISTLALHPAIRPPAGTQPHSR